MVVNTFFFGHYLYSVNFQSYLMPSFLVVKIKIHELKHLIIIMLLNIFFICINEVKYFKNLLYIILFL